MVYWLLQLSDLSVYRVFHLFLAFGAFCWLVWILRLVLSRPYRPFKTGEDIHLPVSVLVPVFNERKQLLEKSLRSITEHISDDDEVLLLVDERDDNLVAQEQDLLLSHPGLRVVTAPPGKRAALRLGFQQAKNPILVVTGSDTYFTASTIPEIIKPFADPEIGGVCGKVIPSTDKGIGGKCYKWNLEMRNIMVYPAMSRSGSVHVMNGECFAVRRELALEYQEEYTNQVFLGKKCESGDDGWITTLLLKYGHKTVFQSTAVAVTEPPSSFWGFLRQQLRWNRNSTRRSLAALKHKWAYQRGALYPLHMFVSLIKSPFWIAVVVIAATRLALGNPVEVISTTWLEPVWHSGRFFIFLGGVVLIRGLRGMPYLLTYPKALLFLPLYAFIAPFILVPYKLYAMITARNTKWLTRGHGGENSGRGKGIKAVARSILMAVIFALALSFPLASLVLAFDDECECY